MFVVATSSTSVSVDNRCYCICFSFWATSNYLLISLEEGRNRPTYQFLQFMTLVVWSYSAAVTAKKRTSDSPNIKLAYAHLLCLCSIETCYIVLSKCLIWLVSKCHQSLAFRSNKAISLLAPINLSSWEFFLSWTNRHRRWVNIHDTVPLPLYSAARRRTSERLRVIPFPRALIHWWIICFRYWEWRRLVEIWSGCEGAHGRFAAQDYSRYS